MSTHNPSDLLPNADSVAGAALHLLVALGHVRPDDVTASRDEWHRAIGGLQALDIFVEQNHDGSYVLADRESPYPYQSDAPRVRELVRRSPSWQREVVSTRRWAEVTHCISMRHAGDPSPRFVGVG